MTPFGKQYRGGRGHRKYCWTVKDVARLTGRAEGTIRNDMAAKVLDMADILSLARYIEKHGEKKE